ncbi:probable serine/threonine-protein kinase clkA [Teleopsis dalmanni]|uniref:probable serine/threonine-protein kinase clkA n=1 Tax=Teleopsis dalmanni TaxID=139649 RepID=UPI0018CCE962|nr:probable serine/threonine-protein kinase clkA [Teleopsis dalmanni]
MHPDGTAHGGSGILVKTNILHFEMQQYRTEEIQATSISTKDWCGSITITSVYCPPKHATKTGGEISTLQPIQAGVPQGSVLGPVLYLPFTNDLSTTVGTEIGTIADDTVVIATDENHQADENEINYREEGGYEKYLLNNINYSNNGVLQKDLLLNEIHQNIKRHIKNSNILDTDLLQNTILQNEANNLSSANNIFLESSNNIFHSNFRINRENNRSDIFEKKIALTSKNKQNIFKIKYCKINNTRSRIQIFEEEKNSSSHSSNSSSSCDVTGDNSAVNGFGVGDIFNIYNNDYAMPSSLKSSFNTSNNFLDSTVIKGIKSSYSNGKILSKYNIETSKDDTDDFIDKVVQKKNDIITIKTSNVNNAHIQPILSEAYVYNYFKDINTENNICVQNSSEALLAQPGADLSDFRLKVNSKFEKVSNLNFLKSNLKTSNNSFACMENTERDHLYSNAINESCNMEGDINSNIHGGLNTPETVNDTTYGTSNQQKTTSLGQKRPQRRGAKQQPDRPQTALFCLGLKNPLREICINIVEWKHP